MAIPARQLRSPRRRLTAVCGADLAAMLGVVSAAARRGGRRSGARGLSHRKLSRAGAGDAARRARAHDRGSRSDLARRHGPLRRRDAAAAETAEAARGHGVARSTAPQHSRQRLAARHRLWRAGGADRGLSARRPGARQRRRSCRACWCSTARPIAGCRGTPPSARSATAIGTSPGIRKAPTAGRPRACRWRRRSPSHAIRRHSRRRAVRIERGRRSVCSIQSVVMRRVRCSGERLQQERPRKVRRAGKITNQTYGVHGRPPSRRGALNRR